MFASVLSEGQPARGLAQKFVMCRLPVIIVMCLILKALFTVLQGRPDCTRPKRRRRRRPCACTFSVATRNELRRRACIIRMCSKGKATKKRSNGPETQASTEPPTFPAPFEVPTDCPTASTTGVPEPMFPWLSAIDARSLASNWDSISIILVVVFWWLFPILEWALRGQTDRTTFVAFSWLFPILKWALRGQTDRTTFAAVLNQTCPALHLDSVLVRHPLALTPAVP